MLIAVDRKLKCVELNSDSDVFEQVWVHVIYPGGGFIFGLVYFPPCSPLLSYQTFLEVAEDVSLRYPKCRLTILGDFNLRHFKDASLEMVSGKCTNIISFVKDGMNIINLQQINEIIWSMMEYSNYVLDEMEKGFQVDSTI